MRSKWVDLMMHRGTIECAEIRFKRNRSPVEAIGKDVVAKSMETEDAALRHARLRPKQPPTKTWVPEEACMQ